MTQLRIRSWYAAGTESGAEPPTRLLLGQGARTLAGLVLLTAAGLKAYESVWLDPPPATFLTHALVAWEVLLGLWLVSGLTRRLSHMTAIGCFVIFIIANFAMGNAGYESCGCYGAVQVHPWISAMLNLGMILVLGLTAPLGNHRWLTPGSRGGVTGLAIVAGVILIPTLMLMSQDRREGYDPNNPAQAKVYVEPAGWLGQELPILAAIDQSDRLQHGRWEILFYRHSCPACRRHLSEMLDGDPPPRHTRRMLVEIPPFDSSSPRDRVRQASWRYARLDETRTWFFRTPTTVRMEDGVVVQVNDERLSEADQQATAAAQQSDTTPSTPMVAFEPPEPHDLGYIPAGGTREFAISIENPLDRDIEIRRVEIECICTNILEEPDVIPASQTIQMPVRFEALREPQPYSKGIALHTHDPDIPVIELTVKADIGIPLIVEPAHADAERLAAEGETTVTIRNRGEEPIRLLYSRSDVGAGTVFAAVPREPIPAGEAVEVPIRVAGDAAAEEALRGYLRIHTSSREQSVLTVPVQ